MNRNIYVIWSSYAFSRFSILITSLGEEKACLCDSRVFVVVFFIIIILHALIFCPCFSSSWCQGLAAASDSGSLWTFLLKFFINFDIRAFLVRVKISLISIRSLFYPK